MASATPDTLVPEVFILLSPQTNLTHQAAKKDLSDQGSSTKKNEIYPLSFKILTGTYGTHEKVTALQFYTVSKTI